MPDSRLVVTIDGPAGAGKTTLARRVAAALGVAYLDTGAMFRVAALRLGPDAPSWPGPAIGEALAGLSFSLRGAGSDTELLACGESAGDEIRTEAVGYLASTLATLPRVRAFLRQAQKDLGQRGSLVAEGRDMGTVVFPDASHKFFLDASPEVRAARRTAQLAAMGKPADPDEILADIRRRDEQDRNRAEAPLRPAPDAVIIDTSALDVDGVFAAIMDHVGQGRRAPA
ncbi:(d)CMP kinase [Desulfolutivibrio sulfoxidireducens]|uniref:(d)CMP kinase n=1 Tax=Desulfolutivibrio sulfoxidireducens TaxID=2773299 RepID=UPI00159E5CE6|nr:(d)CMP kinase [Desulfolutivibrio sulfoxidireducens]QLA15043.1 (d)CMP kinase [Desulfolutivibrio sulfoxidireducens]QLA18612.1 (d)CMP kinase [Desulfolutivibrio sulfoxidireducens]